MTGNCNDYSRVGALKGFLLFQRRWGASFVLGQLLQLVGLTRGGLTRHCFRGCDSVLYIVSVSLQRIFEHLRLVWFSVTWAVRAVDDRASNVWRHSIMPCLIINMRWKTYKHAWRLGLLRNLVRLFDFELALFRNRIRSGTAHPATSGYIAELSTCLQLFA